jgi:hypothetical protein
MRREFRYTLYSPGGRGGLTWLAGWFVRETIEIQSSDTRPQCRQFTSRDEAERWLREQAIA